MNRPVSECSIEFFQNGNDLLAILKGGLRLDNCESIKQRLLPLLVEPRVNIYLHLKQLTELDSAGLGVLVGLHITARKKKIQLNLLMPSPEQQRLFECTRLTSIFTILNGMEAQNVMENIHHPQLQYIPPAVSVEKQQ